MTYSHQHPIDFSYEMRIRWMWILAGSITSLDFYHQIKRFPWRRHHTIF